MQIFKDLTKIFTRDCKNNHSRDSKIRRDWNTSDNAVDAEITKMSAMKNDPSQEKFLLSFHSKLNCWTRHWPQLFSDWVLLSSR